MIEGRGKVQMGIGGAGVGVGSPVVRKVNNGAIRDQLVPPTVQRPNATSSLRCVLIKILPSLPDRSVLNYSVTWW